MTTRPKALDQVPFQPPVDIHPSHQPEPRLAGAHPNGEEMSDKGIPMVAKAWPDPVIISPVRKWALIESRGLFRFS
jgi:hypothetical protein